MKERHAVALGILLGVVIAAFMIIAVVAVVHWATGY